MGIYTDWFLASVDDASALGQAEDPFQGPWPHLGLKGITQTDVAALASILTDSCDDLLQLDALYESPGVIAANRVLATLTDEERAAADEVELEGVIVTQVPPALVEALASLDARHWPTVAAGWAELVEVVDAAELEEHLAEMVPFARRAQESGRPILQKLIL